MVMPEQSASRRRGRPQRQYRIRVRTERRSDIDYAALGRAVLEQAAMDDRSSRSRQTAEPDQQPSAAGGTDPEGEGQR